MEEEVQKWEKVAKNVESFMEEYNVVTEGTGKDCWAEAKTAQCEPINIYSIWATGTGSSHSELVSMLHKN